MCEPPFALINRVDSQAIDATRALNMSSGIMHTAAISKVVERGPPSILV